VRTTSHDHRQVCQSHAQRSWWCGLGIVVLLLVPEGLSPGAGGPRPAPPETRGSALCKLAKSQEDAANYASALSRFQAAREEFRARGDRAGEAIAEEGIARNLYYLHDPDESKLSHSRALKLFSDTGNLVGQAEAMANLGLVYKATGNMKEALPRYKTSLALYEDRGDISQQVILLNNLGQLVLEMGRPEDAIVWFQQSLGLKSDSPEALDTQLMALSGLGMAHYQLGDTSRALDELRRVRKSPRKGIKADLARVGSLKRLASLLLDAGQSDPGKLGSAYSMAKEARGIAHRIKDQAEEAYAIAISGWALEFQGHHRDALNVFVAAQRHFHDRQDKSAESVAYFGIAHAERSMGHLDKALDAMQHSLELVEGLRGSTSSLEMRSSFWSQIRSRYEFYIDLLMELHRLEPGQGHDAQAFEVSETARARTLLDELVEAGAKVRSNANPELLAEDAKLRLKIDQIQQERWNLSSPVGSRSSTAALDQELAAMIARRELVAADLRSSSSEYDEPLKERPRSLLQIQREVLDRDTILLSYWLGEKESFLWRIDRDSLRTYRLPGREQIKAQVIKLRDHFASGNTAIGEVEAARAAAKLGEWLLGPVAGQLKAHHLLILPDGVLQYVPFAALAPPGAATTQGWPDRPLIVDHDIVSLPSASALAVLRRERAGRRPAPHALAVLANPVLRAPHSAPSPGRPSNPVPRISALPDLPFSEEEAQGILRLVPAGERYEALGFKANLETATSPELGRYRIVHFATHSLLDERPDLSGLVLSQFDRQGRPRNGFLTALDLYDLNLPVELVVLSACQTTGKDSAGEGIGRLSRGFLYAGARRVAVTLWSVRDNATSKLMIRLYRGLLQEGLSPAAALRQAQISMRSEKQWKSPYYWAGFVIQGEW
jgi:CHAT domain-containing protein/Tfp pilus assembly protein PilF